MNEFTLITAYRRYHSSKRVWCSMARFKYLCKMAKITSTNLKVDSLYSHCPIGIIGDYGLIYQQDDQKLIIYDLETGDKREYLNQKKWNQQLR